MRRDPTTGLVHNERLVLLTLVELGDKRFHAYALTKFWKEKPRTRSLSYSTLYRCLDQLEQLGYIASEESVEQSGGPSRRVYRATRQGRTLAVELAKTTDERLDLPPDGAISLT